MRVCLLTEGTYPYVRGGVSTWCHELIRGFPAIDFVVYALVSNPTTTPEYELPPNVSRVLTIPLWGHERLVEYNRRDVGRGGRSVKALRMEFLPLFETLLDQIVRGAIRSEVPVAFTQSYEPPPPDDDLVRRLRAAVASVPDLHEAYLVARRTAWLDKERLELGLVGTLARSRSRRGIEAVRAALTPFTPPSESAPLDWCAYSNSPVPEDVRGAGIRLA